MMYLEGGICMVSIYAFVNIGAGVETVGRRDENLSILM
jgi:hypothetical protein